MPVVRVNDINMYYEVHGAGEPLVLIHSFFDLTSWANQIPAFSQKYKVLVFDGRGVGRSDAPQPPYSTDQMADDAAALMDATGFDQAHVLSFSSGGLIAQELAIKHPEKVRKLILASTFQKISRITRYRNDLLLDMLRQGVRPDYIFKNLFLWYFSDGFFENDEAVDAFTKAFLESPYMPPLHALEGQVIALKSHDSTGRLSHIKARTLVLTGREDLILPVHVAEEMASVIPNATLKVVDSAAHCFFLENPEQFNHAVLEFLQNIETPHGQ